MFNVQLQSARDIKRDSRGMPFKWVPGKTIRKFNSAADFSEYIKHNANNLRDTVVWSNNPSALELGNIYLKNKLKEAKVLA